MPTTGGAPDRTGRRRRPAEPARRSTAAARRWAHSAPSAHGCPVGDAASRSTRPHRNSTARGVPRICTHSICYGGHHSRARATTCLSASRATMGHPASASWCWNLGTLVAFMNRASPRRPTHEGHLSSRFECQSRHLRSAPARRRPSICPHQNSKDCRDSCSRVVGFPCPHHIPRRWLHHESRRTLQPTFVLIQRTHRDDSAARFRRGPLPFPRLTSLPSLRLLVDHHIINVAATENDVCFRATGSASDQ